MVFESKSTAQSRRGYQMDDAIHAVAGLVEANRDASHGLRMMAEILEDLPIAQELLEKAEVRDRFASKLAVLMAKYGASGDIPEGGSFKGTRFGWRLKVSAAVHKDDRHAVLEIAADGNKAMQGDYDEALDEALPDDVRRVVVTQLGEIKETGDWIQEKLDD